MTETGSISNKEYTSNKEEKETHILDVENSIFEAWWIEFPGTKRNVKKADACKKFRKGAESDADLIGRLARLKDQKLNDRKWKAGFIPNMSTYLNQERWNLEVELDTNQRQATIRI